jgi:putative heme iron utilization protein
MAHDYQLPQQFVDGIVAHINDDHIQDMLDIAHGLAGCAWAQAATLVHIDTRGIILQARADERSEHARVEFDTVITAPPQFRRAMIELCRRARIALMQD